MEQLRQKLPQPQPPKAISSAFYGTVRDTSFPTRIFFRTVATLWADAGSFVTMVLTYRLLALEDESTLLKMLRYAAHESGIESVLQQPELMRYIEQWGRPGDFGCMAEEDNQAIGAAWLRIWVGHDKGFAYVNDEMPELAMAVLPQFCGQGIGTGLLKTLLKEAAPLYPGITLSVRSDNSAHRLYERMGFSKLEGSEVKNRTGGISYTMVRYFTKVD